MLVEKTISEFISELGSDSPAPGGGSTAALAGALAGALTGMVCSLTVKSAKYADVHDAVQAILDQSRSLTGKLTAYIDEDTQAFNAVMAAFKMPKDSDEEKAVRTAAIQQATKQATLLPLKVAELCLDLISLAGKALAIGNVNAASDAAVAGLLAHAGLKGALYNVRINLPGIKDTAFVDEIRQAMVFIVKQGDMLNRELELAADKALG